MVNERQLIDARVILIGGAPGAGKTTLGCALAARIGAASVTIDDLLTVAKQATTPERHPDLFLFKGRSHPEYFTDSTVAQLIDDAERQHAAIWPFVEKVIAKHFDFTSTRLVIDGWHLRPDRVASIKSANVKANWIHITPEVLEGRERKNVDFLAGSSDPTRMLRNFLGRSLWINELIRSEAIRFDMPVLHQNGQVSAESMCDMIIG